MCRKLDCYCRKRAQPKRELTGFRNSLMIDGHDSSSYRPKVPRYWASKGGICVAKTRRGFLERY
jgi:hypothetical protein